LADEHGSAPTLTEADPAAGEKPQAYYEQIKQRFAEERDLRLRYRPEGTKQYTSDFNGELARYLTDPNADAVPAREAIADEVECLFIGGGFSALLTAARLREHGVTSIRIVERGADVGGTWYWNRYPGVACDVPAYDYLPLLDEMGVVPSRTYAQGQEIFAHCQAIARRYDLYDLAVFNTTVTSTVWNESERLWEIGTDRGDRMRARFVICANGTLSKPKLARIRGMESFKGVSFHTSRWDYDYTGEDLSALSDKVVGIIGTGATAVQAIPRLARAAKALYVFQRTPSSIDIRNDKPTDPEWAANLKPGWQRARREKHLRASHPMLRSKPDVSERTSPPSDGPRPAANPQTPEEIARKRDKEVRAAVFGSMWGVNSVLGADGRPLSQEEKIQRQENANIDYMMYIHRRIDEIVKDKDAADSLKPWYMFMCKRPCFDDMYLPSFNLPSVHLIDTKGEGINEIAEDGVVFGGKTYPVDLLIYATGFEVQKTGLYNTIVGRDGQDINELYSSGIRTMFGIHTHGFPNLFIMGNYQASFQFNLTFMLQTQGEHIANCIKYARDHNYTSIEVLPEKEEWWVQEVITHRGKTNRSQECTPGYYNFEGENNRRQDGNYNGGFPKYYDHIQKVDQEPKAYFAFS